VKTRVGWWCIVVLRSLPCTEVDPIAGTRRSILVDDVVTVYGPFSKVTAHERADQFNARSEVEAADGGPVYRPVTNAPAFLQQECWDEHYAVARPMNDVPW
jgi:hypothetical protein